MEKNRSGIKIVIMVLAAAAVVALLVIAGIYAARRDAEEYGDLDIPEAQEDSYISLFGDKFMIEDDFRTYLIIGTDETDDDVAEVDDGSKSGDYKGGMADFLLLLVVNRTKDSFSFMHLNRDTMMMVDRYTAGGGYYDSMMMQIAGSHAYGATPAECNEHTVAAVKKFLGDIDIKGYYTVKMSDIGAVNALVDGVEVPAMGDRFIEEFGWEEGETVTLTDEQAYEYVHTRYGVGDQTNEERMVRQREFMSGFLEKLRARGTKDTTFIDKAYSELDKVALSDLPGNEVYKIINRVCTGEYKGMYSYDGEFKVADTFGDGVDHMEFYADEDSVISAMKELYGVMRVLDADNINTDEDFDVLEISVDDDFLDDLDEDDEDEDDVYDEDVYDEDEDDEDEDDEDE